MSTKKVKAAPKFVIELAKSGRAACKVCKEKLAKGAIRMSKVSLPVFVVVFAKSISPISNIANSPNL
jgi:hypothetical protein|tara:strand:+ start:113 stop:313 length:201 start_codon:yes stop_codon:yes gene_type:complete